MFLIFCVYQIPKKKKKNLQLIFKFATKYKKMRHFSRNFILKNDTFSKKKNSIKPSKPNIIKHFPTHYTRNFLNFLHVPDIIKHFPTHFQRCYQI